MESVKPINYSKLIRLQKTLFRLVFNRQMTEIPKFNVIYFGVLETVGGWLFFYFCLYFSNKKKEHKKFHVRWIYLMY